MGAQLTATTPDDVAVVPSSARPTRDTLAHEMHSVTSHPWDGQIENHLEVVTGNVSVPSTLAILRRRVEGGTFQDLNHWPDRVVLAENMIEP